MYYIYCIIYILYCKSFGVVIVVVASASVCVLGLIFQPSSVASGSLTLSLGSIYFFLWPQSCLLFLIYRDKDWERPFTLYTIHWSEWQGSLFFSDCSRESARKKQTLAPVSSSSFLIPFILCAFHFLPLERGTFYCIHSLIIIGHCYCHLLFVHMQIKNFYTLTNNQAIL